MIERTSFLGYPVDNLTLDELLEFVENAIAKDEKHFMAVQNANKMYLSDQYAQLKHGLHKASIILPENAINIGMRIIGHPLKQRNMGGVHIMAELLKYANKNKRSIYLLGAEKKVLNLLIEKINSKFANVVVKGAHDGYFNDREIDTILKDIGENKPNILFVALGSPKQEFFIINNFDKLSSNIMIGVGGSFKVLAGLEKPAPQWTKYGFEWLYRSFQDPKKLKRYLVINFYYLYKFITFPFKNNLHFII